MRLYTDHPENSACFITPFSHWEPIETGTDKVLRIFFGNKQPLWTCEERCETGMDHEDKLLLIVDHAPESQFDLMIEALNRGESLPDGLTCLALAGDRHRGQRQRPWTALRGNLHLTAHYRLGCPVRDIEAAVSMVPAVATALAIEGVTPPHCRPGIKWVNDVLLGEEKVSGGLTATHIQGDWIESVVFGIGVNVAVAPKLKKSPLKATSLAPFGVDLGTLSFLLMQHLDRQVQKLIQLDTAAIFSAYRNYADFIGRAVKIWPESAETCAGDPAQPLHGGVVEELLPDLSLRLDTLAEPVRRGRMTYDGLPEGKP